MVPVLAAQLAALAARPAIGTSWVPYLYYGVAASLALYGAHRLWLLGGFRWRRGPRPECAAPAGERFVTVQLPIFNERTVAARLLRAAAALDYPRERLEIQVLDDSTDETRAIIDREVERLRRGGLRIEVLRRETRTGFKAGALQHGLRRARGDLLCIFDADFMPEPSFLRELTGQFDDPTVGMVQARWGHANRDESWLTRAEATLLDGHFVIEHTVRHARGLFFNFNGTAGIWRREAIESAGGWRHDTLTEDLDLSYRAQLCGWRFVYRPMVVAPAEVPADIAAFKSQQRRWAKGGVQVARRLGARILGADQPLRIKLEAVAHLTGNIGYPLVLLMGVLLPMAIHAQAKIPTPVHAALFAACTLSVLVFYERCQQAVQRPLGSRLLDTALAVMMGIGMSLSQTQAVLSGLGSRPGSFVRTPKRGDAPKSWLYRPSHHGLPGLELLLAAWLGWGLYEALALELWPAAPFLLLFFGGHLWVGALSLRHWLGERREARHALPSVEIAPAGPGAREEPTVGSLPSR